MDNVTSRIIITADQIQTILLPEFKRPIIVIDVLAPSLNETFQHFNINTPLREAHFLAQILHESGGLKYSKEIWGPTKAQKKYEFNKSLGNTQPGDGSRFMGRGLIQITGRGNYEALSEYLGIDFVNNPEKLAEAPYNAISAGWFWNKRHLNAIADTDNIEKVTKIINGGYNGLAERKRWLAKVKSVLHSASL